MTEKELQAYAIYKAALDQARLDYADAKTKHEVVQRELEQTEREIGMLRRVIEAMAALLKMPADLPLNESSTRRFTKRMK